MLLIAVGLSMDAFAVAICKGLGMTKIALKRACIVGAWFGAFQGLMPMLGYFLGAQFEKLVTAIAPWLACALLALIGGNMIREALTSGGEETDTSLNVREMFMLAVATSIDAFAVGVSYAMAGVSVIPASQTANALLASLMTAAITFVISAAGVKVGAVFGSRYQKKSMIAGGVILILIGAQLLARHLGAF